MRNKVNRVLNLIGRDVKDPGGAMYHAKDGMGRDGAVGKDKRHKIRKALVRMRLRASGMTDDIGGSKESGGTIENKYEHEPADGYSA